jgi:nucleoside-diphosphate-sugar epimerase
MKILITGGSGFVATNIAKNLNKYEITSICRDDFDLCDPEVTKDFFKDKKFDVVLHTAIVGGNRLIEDSKDIVCDNALMAINLLSNTKSWKKIIHFGSGAELDRAKNIEGYSNNFYNRVPADPYGLSKNIVCRLFANYENIYNLRIFNVFAKNELDRRMIISSVRNYINGEPIVIHQDKMMDFFYMDDFNKILDLYINGNMLPKEIDCVYENKVMLSDIASVINNLSDKKVPVQILNPEIGNSYCGHYNSITSAIHLKGLEQGIYEIYESIINR